MQYSFWKAKKRTHNVNKKIFKWFFPLLRKYAEKKTGSWITSALASNYTNANCAVKHTNAVAISNQRNEMQKAKEKFIINLKSPAGEKLIKWSE